jgi:hypothetical protein
MSDMAAGGLPEPPVLRVSGGLVPSSIADEQISFNECAHAYLAAAPALLLQLREAPGANHKAVDAVIGKIEVDLQPTARR